MSIKDVVREGMRGAFYGRYSTDKQDIEMQRFAVRRFADEHGCEIVKKEYLDTAVSAVSVRLDERKGLMELLHDIPVEKYDFVAVYHHDRLGRQVHEHLDLRERFQKLNIPVVTVADNCLYTEGDILFLISKDAASQYEAVQIRDRTKNAAQSKVGRGKWVGGRCPYGYRYDKQTKLFEQIPEQADIVRRIFKLYRDGIGFQGIADQLKESTGNNWSKERVRLIVTNPFYAGFVTGNRSNKKSHASVNPLDVWHMGESNIIVPIVTKDEWEQALKIYRDRREGGTPPKHYTTPFLLKDLLFCAHCGSKLVGKNQIKRKNGKKYGEIVYLGDCKCNVRIDTTRIHKAVLMKVFNTIIIKSLTKESDDIYRQVASKIDDEVNTLTSEKTNLEAALESYALQSNRAENRTSQMLRKRTSDDEKIIEALELFRAKIEHDIKSVKVQIRQKEERIRQLRDVDANYTVWSELLSGLIGTSTHQGETHLRKLILYIVERITVNRDGDIVDFDARANLDMDHQLDIEIQL